jgi:dienelactone hydrolase
MLVDSYSVARNTYILARQGDPNQAKWMVRPHGVNDDKAFRDPAVTNHLVRPYDLAGAAIAVRSPVPWADPKKLVAIGYSDGGSAVLALSLSKFPLNLSKPNGGAGLFRRLYATYPGCGLDGVNTFYAHSAAMVPLMLGTGTADTETPPGPSPGQSAPAGDCRKRFDQAVAAVAAQSKLYVPTWLDYVGATHSWEITGGADNAAARDDWNRRLLAFVATLK